MFKVTGSSTPILSKHRAQETVRQTQASESIGRSSKTGKQSKDVDSYRSQSSWSTGNPNTTLSDNQLSIDTEPLLKDITPSTENIVFNIYRDMYLNDAIGGGAVDLISQLPFSDFSLGGMSTGDKRSLAVMDAFNETIERLNIRTFIPELTVDYLVLGAHCSSLLYNSTTKKFTDVMPHAVENLTIEPLPFYSQDPIITAKFPDEVRRVLTRTNSKRIDRLRTFLGEAVIDKLCGGALELDPLSTVYVPRTTYTNQDRGTSYFRRLLPIYLIEKSLFRGTLVESARRQRGIMHITAGDGDQWVPTPQDMEYINQLFMDADSDPLGAIITTRQGIDINEIRQGGDFWKVTDFQDSVIQHKLKALNISETLLSGDASYATADANLTVFVDFLRTFRDNITRRFLYNKIFPLVSLINGFTIDRHGKLKINPSLIDSMTTEDVLFRLNDGSKLFIPPVNWNKQLKPEGDTAYIELLNSMSEKGVPVPLRVMAAAGGFNLEDLLKQKEEDLDIRKRIKDYADAISALNPPPADGAESSDYNGLASIASDDPTGKTRSSVLAKAGGRVPFGSRVFEHDTYTLTRTGKKKHVINQRQHDKKVNENIVRAMRDLAKDQKEGRKA